MQIGRVLSGFPSYGVGRGLGKALALICLLGTAAEADEITILAFGDSLTQGYGLPPEDGFVAQMQGWLAARGHDVVLINGGVSGDTTAGGAARIGWSLTEEVDAMILTLGGNDFLRGIAPDVTMQNLDAILTEAEAAGVETLLVGMRANGNYGMEFQSSFDGLYPALAATHDVPLHPYFFQGLGEGTPDSYIPFFQSDRIHPNAEGIRLIVEDIGPSVEALIAGLE